MSAPRLWLRPELCDRCRKCEVACDQQALKVGSGFLFVDRVRCTMCKACVAACPAGAISTTAPDPAAARVVVGSRAEAKTLRRRAEDERRRQERERAKRERAVRSSDRMARREALRAPGAVRWTMGDGVVLLVSFVAGVVGKQVLFGSEWIDLLPTAGQAWARTVVQVVFYALVLSILALLAGRHGAGLVRAFGLHAPRALRDRLLSSALVLVVVLAVRAITTGWATLAPRLGFEPPANQTPLTQLFGPGWAGVILSIALLVLIGPIIEELAFRGVLLEAFAGRGAVFAIGLTSVIFALSHATAWLFVPTFVLGVAAGWIAWSRASVVPAIWLHSLYNLTAVLAAFPLLF